MYMNTLCVFLLLATASASEFWREFSRFVQYHKRIYPDHDEFYRRYHVFADNMKFIHSHNEHPETNTTLGVNNFADLTREEFGDFVSNGLQTFPRQNICKPFNSKMPTADASVDWRTNNAVTPVKDQGQCGSCWSFSATGAMEGAWAIANNELLSFSEEKLIDCSSDYGNHGCNGGIMESAFHYSVDNGICSESEYPYTAKQGQCQQCENVASISGCVDVTPNNQQHLAEAVSIGPVSVAIQADTRVFQLYKSGVITSSDCGTNLDHGVLIVGYGTENNTPYWLVKNSWSADWGDDGYVKIEKSDSTNDKGICGIAMQPSYPVV
jgi:C1A family cysteine protease